MWRIPLAMFYLYFPHISGPPTLCWILIRKILACKSTFVSTHIITTVKDMRRNNSHNERDFSLLSCVLSTWNECIVRFRQRVLAPKTVTCFAINPSAHSTVGAIGCTRRAWWYWELDSAIVFGLFPRCRCKKVLKVLVVTGASRRIPLQYVPQWPLSRTGMDFSEALSTVQNRK